MIDDTITAAAARLRNDVQWSGNNPWFRDVSIVLAALEAAQSSPPREPTREVGWLIEAVAGGRYWCGGSCGWTPSPNLACRFARAADANAAREWLRLPPTDIRVVEHLWTDVAPQTGGKAAPVTKPSQPDHAETAGPPDHQPAATPSCNPGPSPAATDGPAADPIADLCARLCALHIIDEVGSNNPLGREAAATLERLRAERDTLRDIVTDWQWLAEYANAGWKLPTAGTDALALLCGRAAAIIERLRAERDELREWKVGDDLREAKYRALIAERDEARRECVEQARLLGMGGSREAALLAERDTLAAIVRAADAMHLKPTMDNINAWAEARAKWEGK